VKREWRDVVETAKALGMYRTTVLSVSGEEEETTGAVSRYFLQRELSTAVAEDGTRKETNWTCLS
jgi:hypothetical protein